MHMENTEQVLIVILAITLSLFLLVLIVAIVKLIQILNQLKKITAKAEKLANSAESVGELLKNSAGPLALVKLLGKITQALFNRRKQAKGRS